MIVLSLLNSQLKESRLFERCNAAAYETIYVWDRVIQIDTVFFIVVQELERVMSDDVPHLSSSIRLELPNRPIDD